MTYSADFQSQYRQETQVDALMFGNTRQDSGYLGALRFDVTIQANPEINEIAKCLRIEIQSTEKNFFYDAWEGLHDSLKNDYEEIQKLVDGGLDTPEVKYRLKTAQLHFLKTRRLLTLTKRQILRVHSLETDDVKEQYAKRIEEIDVQTKQIAAELEEAKKEIVSNLRGHYNRLVDINDCLGLIGDPLITQALKESGFDRLKENLTLKLEQLEDGDDLQFEIQTLGQMRAYAEGLSNQVIIPRQRGIRLQNEQTIRDGKSASELELIVGYMRFFDQSQQLLKQMIGEFQSKMHELDFIQQPVKEGWLMRGMKVIGAIEEVDRSSTPVESPLMVLLQTKGLGVDTVKALLGKDFASMIHSLEQQQGNAAEHNAAQRQLTKAMLLRIIDVLAEKQCLKRQLQKNSESNPDYQTQLFVFNHDIDLLSSAFEGYIATYQTLPPVKQSLLEAVKNGVWRQLKDSVTVGYFLQGDPTIDELKQSYRYAQMGYSMWDCIQKCVSNITFEQGLDQFLQREVIGFLRWAEKHPKRASEMASDIARTFQLLGSNSSVLEDFQHGVAVKAPVMAFLVPYGTPNVEADELEEELHYRALANLCRILPIISSVLSSAAKAIGDGKGAMGILAKMAGGALKADLVGTGLRMVPSHYEDLILAFTNIIEGEDFRKIFMQHIVIALLS